MKQAAKKLMTTAIMERSISTLKGLKSVSVSFTYAPKENPLSVKTNSLSVDVDTLKTKVSNSKAYQAIKNKITKSAYKNEEDLNVMAAYKYKVIWLDEMGEERETFHITEEERNSKMQALADDGYSPVWRELA
jgi:hypothetical protein